MTTNLNDNERGGFYFKRAFTTTAGILIAWTAWILLPVAVVLMLGGFGSLLPDSEPAAEPTSEFSHEPASTEDTGCLDEAGEPEEC